MKLEPAVGVPQVQPMWLATEGLEMVDGREMLTEVVPLLEPTPALLTAMLTVDEVPLVTDPAAAVRATVRSGPATAVARAVAELLAELVSPPPETVEVSLTLEAEIDGFTVPLTTRLGYAEPPVRASERVHVRVAPALGAPQLQPLADTPGLVRSEGMVMVPVTVPDVEALPWLTTDEVMVAASPAFHTPGETEVYTAGSVPTIVEYAAASSLAVLPLSPANDRCAEQRRMPLTGLAATLPDTAIDP